MQIKFFPDEIETIISEADAAARRLRRRLGLPDCDLDDLRHDLLIDLLRRLPAHNPARGSLGAFAGLILRNQSSRIAMRIMRERRAQGGRMLSLEAASGADDRPIFETIAEGEGLSAWYGQPSTAHDAVDQREVLRSTLARLSAEDRQLCAALAQRSVAALATEGFGSRSTLYRRIADLRHVLTAYGLGPSWDEFATA